MERLHIPWLFLGPTGSGKLSHARKWIEEAHDTKLKLPLESRVFNIGDGYEARVLASPYHFEIDIPNLSMQDKQIIGELLTTFFAAGDVFNSLRNGNRKLVILRRAHSLSLPAAIRVRAILQQFVLPPEGGGMVWITAREITGSLAILDDAFVHYRVPRLPFHIWSSNPDIPPILQTYEAWDRCNGRIGRVNDIVRFFPDGKLPAWPRRIQDFYNEMMDMLIQEALSPKSPTLDIVLWIRGRIYQALSLCQTGPEIIDSFATAIQFHAHRLEPHLFWAAMKCLTLAEPHTSYRTPLALEAALLNLFDILYSKKTVSIEKPAIMQKTVTKHDASAYSPTNELRFSMDTTSIVNTETIAVASGTTANTKPGRRRAAPRKKKSGTE